MITDPEDIDPDVLAEAVKRAQQDNYGTDPVGSEYPSARMSDLDVIRALGKDPLEMMSSSFGREAAAYRAAVGKDQALRAKASADQAKLLREQSDPSYVAQQAYGRLGNIGAARVISKSKGPALFQHGEEVNLGKAGKYYIAPGGYLMLPGKDGRPQRLEAEQVIQMAGVSVIPFLGGDEAATEFRRTTGRITSVMEMLDQLEDIYDSKGSMIIPLSDGRNMAQQIESQLPTLVQSIRSGSNSAAGISDLETEAIKQSLPRRSNWDTLGDLERQKLTMTRQQLRRLIMDRASRNGLEFREIKVKDAKTGAQPQAQEQATKPPAGLSHLNGPK